jgi:hypothetical protein
VKGPDGAVHHKRDKNGQPVITRAHPEVLAAVADAVGGASVDLADRDVVGQLARIVETLRTREIEANRTVQRVEQFPLFLLLAAACLVASFLLSPWRRLAVVTAMVGLLFAAPVGAQQGAQPASVPQPQPQPPPMTASPATSAQEPAPVPEPPAWQRIVPGGSRRMARQGVTEWLGGEVEGAARSFAGAAMLDPENPERLYDLGTALGAGGEVEAATPILEQADAGGVPMAAYNLGTSLLQAQQAEPAVKWLREAVLRDPDDLEAKRNYELALALLEQQQQQQQKDQDQEQDQKDQQDQQDQQEQQEQKQEDEQQQEQQNQQQQPAPTPTPSDSEALFQALERAEAEAREAMQSPTPQVTTVEKDW